MFSFFSLLDLVSSQSLQHFCYIIFFCHKTVVAMAPVFVASQMDLGLLNPKSIIRQISFLQVSQGLQATSHLTRTAVQSYMHSEFLSVQIASGASQLNNYYIILNKLLSHQSNKYQEK